MTTKTLTIMEDAYKMLKKEKKKDESFSQLIRRIMQRRDIMDLAGTMSDETAESIKSSIKNNRENWRI